MAGSKQEKIPRTQNATTALELRPPPAPSTPAKPYQATSTVYEYLTSFSPDAASLAPNLKAGSNTRNDDLYDFGKIQHPVLPWPEFSRATCTTRFRTHLHSRHVTVPSVFVTPQNVDVDKEVASETGVATYINRTVTVQVNRALRAAGCSVRSRGGSDWRDTADCVGVAVPERKLRVVGDYKVSWKWSSRWREEPEYSAEDIEYRQVLSQVHHYMLRNECRWGYVMTDREFVAIERVEGCFGALRVAEAVPWKRGDDDEWGLPLALWYLHAMAGEDDDWYLPDTRHEEQPEFSMDAANGKGKERAQSAPRARRRAATRDALERSAVTEPAIKTSGGRPRRATTEVTATRKADGSGDDSGVERPAVKETAGRRQCAATEASGQRSEAKKPAVKRSAGSRRPAPSRGGPGTPAEHEPSSGATAVMSEEVQGARTAVRRSARVAARCTNTIEEETE
jgi:hypothetical protein